MQYFPPDVGRVMYHNLDLLKFEFLRVALKFSTLSVLYYLPSLQTCTSNPTEVIVFVTKKMPGSKAPHWVHQCLFRQACKAVVRKLTSQRSLRGLPAEI